MWRICCAYVLLFCSFISLTACKKAQPGANIDACTLISKEQVAQIQESPVTDSKSSATAKRGLRVSQCYYSAKESSKSVVLTVTQGDVEHPNKRTARSVWDEMFSEEAREKREKKEEGEEEEKIAAPIQIVGVGDEAYWTGARFGGALYVLKKNKDVFMRISVGGEETADSKMEKSKVLAREALNRL